MFLINFFKKKGFQRRSERTERSSMMDRNRELVLGSWSLAKEWALTTRLSMEEWYFEHLPGRRVFWTQKSKRQHFHYLLFRSPAVTCKDQTFSSWHIFICHHAKVLSLRLSEWHKQPVSAKIFFNLICCKLLASTLKWPAYSLLWSMGLRSGLWVQNLGMLQCAIMWKDQKISSTYICLLWWQTAAPFFSPSPQTHSHSPIDRNGT